MRIRKGMGTHWVTLYNVFPMVDHGQGGLKTSSFLMGKVSGASTQWLKPPRAPNVDPLEKEVATHSSVFAWEIPWTEEPGRLHP